MNNQSKEKFSNSAREFDLAWKEFFKDKPNPKTDEEEKKEMEEFTHWYNNVRKQSDTGKTPAEMYKEIYDKEPPEKPVEMSRMINFEWDEDYDEELIGLIYELQEYDNDKGYKLDYKTVKEKLQDAIKNLIDKGDSSLDELHKLLKKPYTWSSLFTLEILKEIKNEKSVPYLIEFILDNENGDYFENCDEAANALEDIGALAVNKIISVLEKGIKNEIYHAYLFEALSKIKDRRGSEFRLNVLRDYLNDIKKYSGWFNLTLFVSDFNEDEKDALHYLKQLREFNLNKEEKIELDGAIERIEDPEEYDRKGKIFGEQIESLWNKSNKRKIGRNEPCPCGSGKKYKKCCLGKV